MTAPANQAEYATQAWETAVLTDPTLADLRDAVHVAGLAAHGDSNDDEIDALRHALELALGHLRLTLIDPYDEPSATSTVGPLGDSQAGTSKGATT